MKPGLSLTAPVLSSERRAEKGFLVIPAYFLFFSSVLLYQADWVSC